MSHAHHAGMTISVDGASSAPLACVGAEPFLQYWPADAGLPQRSGRSRYPAAALASG